MDCGTTDERDGLTGFEAAAYIHGILANHTTAPNVVLSHGDKDHYSHIATVLNGIEARNIWLGGQTSTYSSSGFRAWLSAQRGGGATIVDDDQLPVG